MPDAISTNWLREHAEQLGFSLCAIVRPEKFPELANFDEWLARGYAGEMRYLSDPRRRNPSLVLENARSIVVCALNYNTAHPSSIANASSNNSTPPRGWISRYAWGTDYHEILWEKLNALLAAIHEKYPEPFAARAYADTGPLAERIFAKHAGLGWLGKNTLLLNKKLGSFFFLGVILTSLDLEPSLSSTQSPPPDLCGSCRKCLDACPTGALVEPYVMDARRCISYLTIELRGSIPLEFREPIGNHVFGCDICQDVCPYNRSAPLSDDPQSQPRSFSNDVSLFAPNLEWLANLSVEEFREFFRGSAIKRTKWQGLIRNACIALGNSHLALDSPDRARILALLHRLINSPDPATSDSAQWALSRLSSSPVQPRRGGTS